jgi:RimJ/RimL family protein N-acetyltransferase
MIRPLYGQDAAVARWVGNQVGITDFGLCTAIGFMRDDELIAGVVFNNWHYPSDPGLMEATIASTTPRWCNRATLGVIFGYPFNQVGCRRLTATTEAKNQPVRAFLCHLGFREEGVIRQGFPTDDAVVYGMLRDECRWMAKEQMDRCAA